MRTRREVGNSQTWEVGLEVREWGDRYARKDKCAERAGCHRVQFMGAFVC